MINQIRNVRKKLGEEAIYGVFSKTCDPGIIECMGHNNFDFVILDLEHGPNTVQTMQNLIRAAELSEILPIVRIKEGVESVIGEVLDIGAGGIQIPQVTTAEMAKHYVELSKFAPLGKRGVCRFVRAAHYSSMDRKQYFDEANESIIIAQIEGDEAIQNIDEIIEVEGIDIIFLGPYDLSQSLGVPGEIEHPLVVEKLNEIIERCNQKGKCVGIFADTIEQGRNWIAKGVKYMAYSVDMGIMSEACSGIMRELKEK